MTSEQLTCLQAIVNTGSFRAAADHLHKVQSAVSHSIKTLEEELSFTLFDRSTYRPQLTPRGRLFFEKAQDVLRAEGALKDYAYLLAHNTEPELRLSLTALTPLAALTEVLHQVQKQYQNLQLRMEILNLRAPVERLQDGEVDIILTEFPLNEDGYESRKCGEVLLKPFAAPHMIQPFPKKISEEELRHYTQIVVADNASTRTSTNISLLEGAPKWRVTDFYTKKELLLAGLGWGNMPLHLIQTEIKNKTLLPLPCEKVVCVPLYLVRRIRKQWGPASHYIWSALEWT